MNSIFRLIVATIVVMIYVPSLVHSQIQNPKNLDFDWETDTLKSEIALSELTMVLPRGSFSKIDFPAFLDINEGLKAFFNHEPVISIEISGKAKAYPLNMLTMHEMSNDTLGGMAILPTYCPLCNSSLVFNRKVKTLNGGEKILNFEVSGMLRYSDMVMGDQQTSTLWQQLTGYGIVGENAGAQLEILPSQVISVAEFFDRYPDGEILSPKTGTKSEDRYGTNPYVSYDDKSGTPYARFFNPDRIDDRLPPMERIVNIRSVFGSKVYPFSILRNKKVVNDTFDGIDLVLFFQDGSISILDQKDISKSKSVGSATAFSPLIEGKKHYFFYENNQIKDKQSRSTWDITGKCILGSLKGRQLDKIVHSNHFAFAWLNFYPESEIYRSE